MSLEDLKHNIQSILESVNRHDEFIEQSKKAENEKQLKKINKELVNIKEFISKLSKQLIKSIEHERRKIKA